jgi:coenzyme F420-dependent glucose-6-phosphate dehydrogenase
MRLEVTMAWFGWKAGPEQYPPVELLDYAVEAERAGFDSLEVSDHFHPWSEDGQAAFTWSWLGAAAARTSQIHLGPGVTCPILRYHPSVIAQAAATQECLAPARTFLCVGTGEALNEYAATGVWPGYAERQNRLEEAIELIRALWTGQEVTYDGFFYTARKARLFTLPDEPPDIYVSSLVPESAEFAGRVGDGLITVGGRSADVYSDIIRRFERGARDAGRDPSTMPRLIELNVAYTDDTNGAIECFRRYWAGSFIPALFDQKIYTPKMSQDNGSVVGADAITRRCCISSNPDDHVLTAKHFLDLGFNQLYFHCAGPDQRDFIRQFGQDVLPRLRAISQRDVAAA